ELVAGVEQVEGGRMIRTLADSAAVEADVVHAPGKLLEMLADLDARPAGFAELERAADEVPRAAFHLRGELVLTDELRHVQAGELRFRIESIEVAGTALHGEEDAGFRLGGMMGRFWREDAGAQFFLVEKRAEGDAGQPGGGAKEEVAAGNPNTKTQRHKVTKGILASLV